MAHKYSHYNIMPFVQSSHDLPRLEHQQSDLRVSTNEVIRQKFHAHVPTSIELPSRVRTYNLCAAWYVLLIFIVACTVHGNHEYQNHIPCSHKGCVTMVIVLFIVT